MSAAENNDLKHDIALALREALGRALANIDLVRVGRSA